MNDSVKSVLQYLKLHDVVLVLIKVSSNEGSSKSAHLRKTIMYVDEYSDQFLGHSSRWERQPVRLKEVIVYFMR